MKPSTEEFLNLVRDAEAPSASDEERIMLALRASIAAGVASTVAVNSSALPALLARENAGSAGFLKLRLQQGIPAQLGSKLSVLAVTAAASFGAADAPLAESANRGAAPPARAASASSVAEHAAPAPSAERAIAPEAIQRPAPPVLAAPRKPQSQFSQAPRAVSSLPDRPATLRAELELLAGVQADLRRGDGANALRRLDAHRTGDRQFLAERSAARILALCAMGNVKLARRAASDFFASEPDSLQREAIANSCANPSPTRE